MIMYGVSGSVSAVCAIGLATDDSSSDHQRSRPSVQPTSGGREFRRPTTSTDFTLRASLTAASAVSLRLILLPRRNVLSTVTSKVAPASLSLLATAGAA